MSRTRMLTILAPVLALGAAEPSDPWPRLIGQLTVGTPGLEVAAAAEWVLDTDIPFRVRPTVLINDRPLPGVGCSLGWSINDGKLPEKQELFFGPNVVYHNNRRDHPKADEEKTRYGLEIGVLGTYAVPIVHAQPGHHWVEAVVAIGAIDHEGDWGPALTIGAAYGYQF